MKYKCLVLDHDDTTVDSTRTVHFPCFLEFLERYRPALLGKYSYETYLSRNFTPGIIAFFMGEIGLSEEECLKEQEYWNRYVLTHTPKAFPKMAEILTDYRARGGFICVASHSFAANIERDYRANGLPLPDAIYGWDLPPADRKPSPYTIFELERKYGFSQSEILVVDDLKPGLDMAKAAGCDIAASGWAYDIPMIRETMEREATYYCETVEDFRRVLFS